MLNLNVVWVIVLMMQNNKQRLITCLLFFFFSGINASLSAAEKNPQKKLQLVKQELTQISRNLKNTEKTKSNQLKNIQSFDADIAKLSRQLKTAKTQTNATKTKISVLKTRSDNLAASILSNKKGLSKMSHALYLRGDDNYLKILMNHSDANEQSRMRAYYDYFYRAFEQQQTVLSNDLAQLSQVNEALEKKLTQYILLLKKIKKETSSLQIKRKSKKLYLTTLDKQIRSKQQKIRTLNSSRKTLEKLLTALKKRKHREKMARLSGMSFAKSKGRLQWPVKGKLRHKFGQSRGNTDLKWRGVLLAAKAGENVKTIDGGTIVFSDWLRGYGFVIIIDHGKNYMSLYGYNQQLLKSVGDKVLRGDVIAEAGNSGRLGEPGVYFEIRRKGKPVNPAKWMVARSSR